MATFKDLEHCTYFPVECKALTAVGWLGKASEFEKGAVTAEFFRKLCELTSKPWQAVVSGGFQVCELCQFDGPRFSENVFIPYKGRIFVAPVGIIHYIAAHWYRPPEIFMEAVLACPPMDSMQYKKALLSNGGRELINMSS